MKLSCCPEQYHLGLISNFVHKVALGCRVPIVKSVFLQGVLTAYVMLYGPFLKKISISNAVVFE